jgi:hypothetical protein
METFLGALMSHGQTQIHKTHHDLNLGEAIHHFVKMMKVKFEA